MILLLVEMMLKLNVFKDVILKKVWLLELKKIIIKREMMNKSILK